MDIGIHLDLEQFSYSQSLLPTILAMAITTKQGVSLQNIRHTSRKECPSQQGLLQQDLDIISLAQDTCKAVVKGAGIGSTELVFVPSTNPLRRRLKAELTSQDSITQALQTLLIPLITSGQKHTINLQGITHCSSAPSTTYLRETLFRLLQPYCVELSSTLQQFGFAPQGKGDWKIVLQGRYSLNSPKPFKQPTPFSLIAHKCFIYAHKDLASQECNEKLKDALTLYLSPYTSHIHCVDRYVTAQNKGLHITLLSLFGNNEGFDNDTGLVKATEYSHNKNDCTSEQIHKIVQEIIRKYKQQSSKKYLEEDIASFIIPLLAIQGGSCEVASITNHLENIMQICEQMLDISFTRLATVISCENPWSLQETQESNQKTKE